MKPYKPLFLLLGLIVAICAQPLYAQTSDEQKKQFVQKLAPRIELENSSILKKRARLVVFVNSPHLSDIRSQQETEWILILGKEYGFPNLKPSAPSDLLKLLLRVDVLPPRMALAQSAIETGWGTSRFAREANNFFGQWCFRIGCGLVPKRRTKGSTHEVRKFDSATASVKAYFHNINTHRAFYRLRLTRAELGQRTSMVAAQALAKKLGPYSEEGEAYTKKVLGIMKSLPY